MTDKSADPEAVAGYYEWLWTSTRYSGPAPNDEERCRLKVITDMVTAALAHCGVRQFNRILDLGCGRGWLLPYLKPYGPALGADPVPTAIDIARQLFPLGQFVCQDAATLAMDQRYRGQFDLVVASEVIEHVEDHQDFLSAIARLLVPGGFLLLTTPRGECFQDWSRAVPPSGRQPVEHWLTEAELQQAAASAGFSLLARRRIYAPFTAVGIYRLLNSERLLRALGQIGLASWFETFRSRWALYQVILFTLCQGRA